jgi:hypothetical protein
MSRGRAGLDMSLAVIPARPDLPATLDGSILKPFNTVVPGRAFGRRRGVELGDLAKHFHVRLQLLGGQIHDLQERLSRGQGVLGCEILVAAQSERSPISRRLRGRQLIQDVRKRLAPLIQAHMTCEVEPGDLESNETT